MLADSSAVVRLEAAEMIQTIRKEKRFEADVRYFRPPEIFGTENTLKHLLSRNIQLTEPPLTRQMPNEMLLDVAKREPLHFEFPCHSQNVERMVRDVTEAARRVCGETRRDGFILVWHQSRREMPSFSFKKDFPKK